MSAGKFIVIEGTDGSGKATQLNRCVQNLTAKGYAVETVDFPQYGTKSAGPVEEYLNGKYGDVHEVSPYVASLFYAVDRFDASFKIRAALRAEKIVLANRYVSSNAAHQGAKLAAGADRTAFLHWIDALEYDILKLPHPDRIIFLHMPAEIGFKLVEHKQARHHLQGKVRDIHEANLAYLKEVEENYLALGKDDQIFKTVECAPQGTLLSIEEINSLVMKHIYALLS